VVFRTSWGCKEKEAADFVWDFGRLSDVSLKILCRFSLYKMKEYLSIVKLPMKIFFSLGSFFARIKTFSQDPFNPPIRYGKSLWGRAGGAVPFGAAVHPEGMKN
jgi:hypothetical protein